MEQDSFEVVEVNQWIASKLSNIRDLDFDNFHPLQVDGPDTASTTKIIGGYSWWRGRVRKNDIPALGHVWFVKGLDGKMKEFKSNIDSSD